MSIRIKLPLIILITFLLNIFLLGGYYRFFLSKEMSNNYSKIQMELEADTKEISMELQGKINFEDRLEEFAKSKNFIIHLENLNGNIIFETGDIKGFNLGLNASSVVKLGDGLYLLKIMKSLPVDKLPSIRFVQKLFIAEFFIILIILSLLTAVVYLYYVKPIVALQKDIDHYKDGIKPCPTKRMDEVGWLQNRFVELTETIDAEKQKQNRIIASISHDIKTPLTSVMGYAEQLQKGKLSEQRRQKYTDTVYEKSIRIKELIDEFDDYLSYNLQSTVKKQKITAGRLCELLKEEYSDELLGGGIMFSVSCDCHDVNINVDFSKIRRVFGNIISNSLKIAKDIGPKINVFCRKKEEYVVFSVSDNGIGVPEDELEKIFEPLYTSDQSRKVAGLGLSICKSIVETHDGKIWACNENHGGLKVSFSIPIET